jgi:hypothetical protein
MIARGAYSSLWHVCFGLWLVRTRSTDDGPHQRFCARKIELVCGPTVQVHDGLALLAPESIAYIVADNNPAVP